MQTAAVKFSPMTRIGNWQEEIALEEAKIASFQKRSNDGSGNWKKLQTKMGLCNEIVPHTYSEDGIVRFGDSVVLQHDSSNYILSCDPFDEVIIGQEKYFVSGIIGDSQPKARSTFRITRPPQNQCNFTDDPNDPIVHIGQPFVLTCNESLLVTPGSNILSPTLYLCSTKKNERTATKRTNRQMAYISPVCDADAIWIAIVPSKGRTNGPERLLAMGSPISVERSLQLTHRQTNMYLTLDISNKLTTEFGVEIECYADRSVASGKLGLMVSEFKGLSTSQTLSKPDAPTFSWHFVLSSDANTGIDKRSLPPPATNETILKEIQDSIRTRGIDAFWCLRDYLKQLCNKMVKSEKIEKEDLKATLIDFGINVKPKYLDLILSKVDSGKLGLVEIKDVMQLLRGPTPKVREDIVSKIFFNLDKEGSGLVNIDELSLNFRGEDHPLVSIGGYTEKDALNHLLKTFESQGKLPKVITFEKFLDYYADLSASIDDDDYFISLVRSNWSSVL